MICRSGDSSMKVLATRSAAPAQNSYRRSRFGLSTSCDASLPNPKGPKTSLSPGRAFPILAFMSPQMNLPSFAEHLQNARSRSVWNGALSANGFRLRGAYAVMHPTNPPGTFNLRYAILSETCLKDFTRGTHHGAMIKPTPAQLRSLRPLPDKIIL